MQKVIISLITLFVLQSSIFSQASFTYRDNTLEFKMKTDHFMSSNKIAASIKDAKKMTIDFWAYTRCFTKRHQYTSVYAKGDKLYVYSQRKGSKKVAHCFTDWLKDEGTKSFKHNPSKLNFAFEGDLLIMPPGTNGFKVMIAVQDMVLAQGHAGASNNWWIGGVHCKNISKHRLECPATNARVGYGEWGYNLPPVCFKRRHNHVHTIEIVDC